MEKRIENEKTILTMPKKVDVLSAPNVEAELLALVENGTTPLGCDFSACDYVSSAGLRVLLVVSKRMASRGGEFFLFGMNEDVFSAFHLSGFDKIMTIQ